MTAGRDLPPAVFFDMDGTLLDWQSGMEESWLASCSELCDGSYDPARLHEAIRERRTWFWSDPGRAAAGRMDLDGSSRRIVRDAFAQLGVPSVAHAERIADDYRARRDACIALYDGALETLETLRAAGTRMALITNGNAIAQRRSVVRFGLADYFDCVIIEGEFGAGKPDERLFHHALQVVSADPRDVWMVGDSLEADIATPLRLGMHTIWVDSGAGGLPEDAPGAPHRTIRTIRELLEA